MESAIHKTLKTFSKLFYFGEFETGELDHGGELSDIGESELSPTTELNSTRNSLNVMFEGISP